jgi:hypothetical protein
MQGLQRCPSPVAHPPGPAPRCSQSSHGEVASAAEELTGVPLLLLVPRRWCATPRPLVVAPAGCREWKGSKRGRCLRAPAPLPLVRAGASPLEHPAPPPPRPDLAEPEPPPPPTRPDLAEPEPPSSRLRRVADAGEHGSRGSARSREVPPVCSV